MGQIACHLSSINYFILSYECISVDALPWRMTQGLITLIPKPKKHLLLIDSWRPICLLNNNYKIVALAFAQRIKPVLESITDEEQFGFLPNRHISNNIRLILDMLN